MDIIGKIKSIVRMLSLTEEKRALLPDNPAGLLELSDANLESVMGGQAHGNIVVNYAIYVNKQSKVTKIEPLTTECKG